MLDVGGWRLDVRCWSLEIVGWRLEVRGSLFEPVTFFSFDTF